MAGGSEVRSWEQIVEVVTHALENGYEPHLTELEWQVMPQIAAMKMFEQSIYLNQESE